MCLFRKKARKIRKLDYNDPFTEEKRRKDAVIIVSGLKVGEKFRRSWSERIGNISARLVADYTVTRIEDDLITLESPHEKTIQLTRMELIERLSSVVSDRYPTE